MIHNTTLEILVLKAHVLFSDISQECFEKSRQGLRILPLHSKKDFVLLYCEEMPYMRTIPKVLSPGRSRKRDSKGIIACQSKESSITIPVSSNLSKMHSLDARSFDG